MSRISTPVSAAPTRIYNPGSQGTPHAVIYNAGTATIYLGGVNVSPATGFPLPPTGKITIANAQTALYAAAGGAVTSGSLTLGAALVAGSTSLSASAITGIVVGQPLSIGNTSTEVVTVTSTSTSKVVTFTPATGFYHPSGGPLKFVTGASGSCAYVESAAS